MLFRETNGLSAHERYGNDDQQNGEHAGGETVAVRAQLRAQTRDVMNISPVIIPATARPIPSLRPAIVNGIEPGSSTLQNRWRRLAPNERAI